MKRRDFLATLAAAAAATLIPWPKGKEQPRVVRSIDIYEDNCGTLMVFRNEYERQVWLGCKKIARGMEINIFRGAR